MKLMTISYKKIRIGILIVGTIFWVLGIAFIGTIGPVLRVDESVVARFAFSPIPENEAAYRRGQDLSSQLMSVVFIERLVNHWPEYTLWSFLVTSLLLLGVEEIVKFMNQVFDLIEDFSRRVFEFAKSRISSLF